ncbi:hypothetical protein BLNAU_8964 [Blattamonas nauphoetae]|uniref:Uncharacterized protein n=1 Tax=Blattamonas nauphoetae TaxID=2049346 RepID=A0ABQ9XWY0_9EUKA|nr:hypothetical protein BLNAU_8964 [Blattamonas nauphoetae]
MGNDVNFPIFQYRLPSIPEPNHKDLLSYCSPMAEQHYKNMYIAESKHYVQWEGFCVERTGSDILICMVPRYSKDHRADILLRPSREILNSYGSSAFSVGNKVEMRLYVSSANGNHRFQLLNKNDSHPVETEYTWVSHLMQFHQSVLELPYVIFKKSFERAVLPFPGRFKTDTVIQLYKKTNTMTCMTTFEWVHREESLNQRFTLRFGQHQEHIRTLVHSAFLSGRIVSATTQLTERVKGGGFEGILCRVDDLSQLPPSSPFTPNMLNVTTAPNLSQTASQPPLQPTTTTTGGIPLTLPQNPQVQTPSPHGSGTAVPNAYHPPLSHSAAGYAHPTDSGEEITSLRREVAELKQLLVQTQLSISQSLSQSQFVPVAGSPASVTPQPAAVPQLPRHVIDLPLDHSFSLDGSLNSTTLALSRSSAGAVGITTPANAYPSSASSPLHLPPPPPPAAVVAMDPTTVVPLPPQLGDVSSQNIPRILFQSPPQHQLSQSQTQMHGMQDGVETNRYFGVSEALRRDILRMNTLLASVESAQVDAG